MKWEESKQKIVKTELKGLCFQIEIRKYPSRNPGDPGHEVECNIDGFKEWLGIERVINDIELLKKESVKSLRLIAQSILDDTEGMV